MKSIPGVFSSGGFNYPAEPRQQVLELLTLLKPYSHVLDIGAGFGNNCLPLLEKGHHVTVTETNDDAIGYLSKLKAKFPKRLIVVKESAEQLRASPTHDAIIATMVLQFLTPAEAMRVIGIMKQATAPKGYHVIINYLSGQDLDPEYTFLLDKQSLPQMYEGWNILSYEETKKDDTDGKKYYTSAKMIAQKP